jgi:riboflavin kinase/FMN adenylyltransferase
VHVDTVERVAIIGVFDGVHRGHRGLIAEARRQAGVGEVFALTFDPHPRAVVAPEHAPPLLCTVGDREKLLRQAGVDEVIVIPFDVPFSRLSPRDFVTQFIYERVRATLVIVGSNFRFGHKGAGDGELLGALGADMGFRVSVLEPLGDSERFSSSRARTAILEGRMDEATEVLGRAFSLSGPVVHGDHRGRELGIPTANVDVEPCLVVPQDGVYVGRLTPARGSALLSAISVGTNPHYLGNEQRIEAHVLDHEDLDLYGQAVSITFEHRLRGQMVFSTEQELVQQMLLDVEEARQWAADGVRERRA